MTTMKDLVKALKELQNEEDDYDLNITNIATTTEVTVSVYDNPLTPQAVFSVMNCFITMGVRKVEWLSPTDRDEIDLVATINQEEDN